MSNSSSLHVNQLVILNKLYSHSNLLYSYFTHNHSPLFLYYVWFTPTAGLNTLGRALMNFFTQNVFVQLFYSHHKSPVFKTSSISKRNKQTAITKLQPLFKRIKCKKITNLVSNSFTYVQHNSFALYKTHFLSSSVPLLSPFIRKKSRIFSFYMKAFTKKGLKTQRLNKKIFSSRKF